MLLPQKQKKVGKGNRFLISVSVFGSAGPIRFLVKEYEVVAGVIDTALKSYAREGRFPALGSNSDEFFLYCANSGTDALSPWETIGSHGGRNFVLCRKESSQQKMADEAARTDIVKKGAGGWKAWLNKSLSLKISTH